MGCLPSSLNKGRTATSAIGLFPKSFTTPNPPEAAPTSPAVDVQMPEPEPQSPIVLQTLREVSEAGPTGFPDPDPLGDSTPRTTDGEVMHATMTDVQKAIEQLGRHDVDGSRSFSFASSRGEGDGDWTDRDSATDTDGEADGWHLNARQRLAENSRVINEESTGPSTPMRISAPPIEVELSDESGAEDDERTSGIHDKQSPRLRHHPNISEEEEEAQTSVKARPSNISTDLDPGTPVVASDAYIVPSPGTIVDDLPTATIPRRSFIMEQDQQARRASLEPNLKPAQEPEPEVKLEPQFELVPPTQIPLPTSPSSVNGAFSSPSPSTPPSVVSPIPVSPISLTNTPERSRTPTFQSSGTPSSSTITSIGIQQVLGSPTKPQSSFRPQENQTPPLKRPTSSLLSNFRHPTEWTVEEVVDWLKGKGIDQGACDKFIGILVLMKVRLRSIDIPLYRTRYYWRRSPGVGHRVAQIRDRYRCVRKTEAHCQRHCGVENARTNLGTRTDHSFREFVLPLKKRQFGSGIFVQQFIVIVIGTPSDFPHEPTDSRWVLPQRQP